MIVYVVMVGVQYYGYFVEMVKLDQKKAKQYDYAKIVEKEIIE